MLSWIESWDPVKKQHHPHCPPMVRALHPNPELAAQQVNAFFRGPVISMMYARWLGPQIDRERNHDTVSLPSHSRKEDGKNTTPPPVTKNFARVRAPSCTMNLLAMFQVTELVGLQGSLRQYAVRNPLVLLIPQCSSLHQTEGIFIHSLHRIMAGTMYVRRV